MERFPIRKTEQCFSEEDLLHYVTGMLSVERRDSMAEHLASCLYCLYRSGEVHDMAEAAREKACAQVIPQLTSYLGGNLIGQEMESVRTHLLVCRDCFDRYDRLVEEQMQAEWEGLERVERPSPARRAIELVLGLISNFPDLSPRWIPSVQAVSLAAQGEQSPGPQVENWQEFKDEGITVTLALDIHDHLLVALESDCYAIGRVTVSLRMRTDTGVKEAKSVVTDAQGQADFGLIKDIHRPDHDGYILVIKGLSELPNPSGREEHNPHMVAMFRKAQAFFQAHLDEVVKQYEGKYIAILADRVVDADEEFSSLAERVYARYGYGPIYMPKVAREPQKASVPTPRLGANIGRRQGNAE